MGLSLVFVLASAFWLIVNYEILQKFSLILCNLILCNLICKTDLSPHHILLLNIIIQMSISAYAKIKQHLYHRCPSPKTCV